MICSGEYNHGIPPALKNLLDHFLEEYFWRPSAIACYSAGSFGGVRAAMQLRMSLAEMGMSSIPSILPFPGVSKLVSEAGELNDPRFQKQADRFLSELEWYAEALRERRAHGLPV
jgi:NAD(P)H-dependent FMN reductase